MAVMAERQKVDSVEPHTDIVHNHSFLAQRMGCFPRKVYIPADHIAHHPVEVGTPSLLSRIRPSNHLVLFLVLGVLHTLLFPYCHTPPHPAPDAPSPQFPARPSAQSLKADLSSLPLPNVDPPAVPLRVMCIPDQTPLVEKGKVGSTSLSSDLKLDDPSLRLGLSDEKVGLLT